MFQFRLPSIGISFSNESRWMLILFRLRKPNDLMLAKIQKNVNPIDFVVLFFFHAYVVRNTSCSYLEIISAVRHLLFNRLLCLFWFFEICFTIFVLILCGIYWTYGLRRLLVSFLSLQYHACFMFFVEVGLAFVQFDAKWSITLNSCL